MKTAKAIMTFLNKGPCLNEDLVYTRCTTGEIKELKESCTQVEWTELGRQACDILGEPFEE